MRGHHSEQVRTDGRNAGTLTTSELIAEICMLFFIRDVHVAFARNAGKERCRYLHGYPIIR
jgi:hypothetical protein